VCHSKMHQLTVRIREQARSHMWLCVSDSVEG
jgi:hypothetical protein